MERNDDNIGNPGGNSNSGSFGNSGDLTGSERYGALPDASPAASPAASPDGEGAYGAAGSSAGSFGNAGTSGNGADGGSGAAPSADGMTDRAREIAGDARERLADTGTAIRDRAGSAKNSIADMLEAGANRLNNPDGSTQLAGATGTGAVATSNRMSGVAGGLQGSADWLRDADIDGMKQGIESQVRSNPGRSMLLAVGLGYLVGKALRR